MREYRWGADAGASSLTAAPDRADAQKACTRASERCGPARPAPPPPLLEKRARAARAANALRRGSKFREMTIQFLWSVFCIQSKPDAENEES